jgi:hypothetical protein
MTIIRTIHEKNFTIIANGCLQDDSLSAEALGVLCYLLGRPDNWTVRPTQLADRFDCGREKIDRIIKELVTTGYVIKTQTRDPVNKTWNPIEYTVYQIPKEVPNAVDGKAIAENPLLGSAEVLNTDITSTDSTSTEKKTDSGHEGLFEEVELKIGKPAKPVWPRDYQTLFWDRYPNKKAKGNAVKALDRICTGGKTEWDDLMDGLERYIISEEVRRGFVKHPATWLNAQCWCDEAGPPRQPDRQKKLSFFEIAAGHGD